MALVFASPRTVCCPPRLITLDIPTPCAPAVPLAIEDVAVTSPVTADLHLLAPAPAATTVTVVFGTATATFNVTAGATTVSGTVSGVVPPLPTVGTFLIPGCPPLEGPVVVNSAG